MSSLRLLRRYMRTLYGLMAMVCIRSCDNYVTTTACPTSSDTHSTHDFRVIRPRPQPYFGAFRVTIIIRGDSYSLSHSLQGILTTRPPTSPCIQFPLVLTYKYACDRAVVSLFLYPTALLPYNKTSLRYTARSASGIPWCVRSAQEGKTRSWALSPLEILNHFASKRLSSFCCACQGHVVRAASQYSCLLRLTFGHSHLGYKH